MFPHPITAKCARNRSVGHHRRAREGGRVISSLPCSAKGTQPVVSSSASVVVVSVSRLALHRSSLARPVRHPHLADNRPILLPLGLLPMRYLTTLAIHSRSADNSCIRSRPLTDGSLPPSFLPSSLVSHYSIRLSRRRSLPKMTNSRRRRRRRRRRRSDGAMAEKRMPVQ